MVDAGDTGHFSFSVLCDAGSVLTLSMTSDLTQADSASDDAGQG